MFKKIKAILELPINIWQMFVTYLPGSIGFKLRRLLWKKRLKYLGKNVRIDIGAHFQNPGFISLDDNSWIDRNVIIIAGVSKSERITFRKENPDFKLNPGEVFIGKYVHVAPNCVLSGIGGIYVGDNSGIASNSAIYSFSHHYRNLNDKSDKYQYVFSPHVRQDQQSMISGPVVIEEFCALGLSSIVLPGVTIKKGSWVASGTIVSKTYTEHSLIFVNQEVKEKSLSEYIFKV